MRLLTSGGGKTIPPVANYTASNKSSMYLTFYMMNYPYRDNSNAYVAKWGKYGLSGRRLLPLSRQISDLLDTLYTVYTFSLIVIVRVDRIIFHAFKGVY